MTTLDIDTSRGIERGLRQLKRILEKKGNLAFVKQRKHHSKPTTERKKAKAAAVKRHKKLLQKNKAHMNAQRNHFSRKTEH